MRASINEHLKSGKKIIEFLPRYRNLCNHLKSYITYRGKFAPALEHSISSPPSEGTLIFPVYQLANNVEIDRVEKNAQPLIACIHTFGGLLKADS